MLELVIAEHGGGLSGTALRLVNTWSDDAGTVFARAFVDGPRCWIDWPGVGAFEFTRTSPTVVLHGAPLVDRARARDIFFRIVQPIVLQAQGTETLHASAVEGPCGVVAFAGISGNGKSTLAWALGRRAGFRQVADDAVVLDGLDGLDGRPTAGQVRVRPLPHEPRLRPSAQRSLAQGTPLSPISADTPTVRPRLCAIVLLEQAADAESAASPTRLAPSAAFPAVLAHAYCYDEGDKEERERMVRHYLDIAAAVPVFRLCYRPDFQALPDLLSAVVAITSAAEAAPRTGGSGR